MSYHYWHIQTLYIHLVLYHNIQEQILDERINAQKNYKISSTPTIYINKKQYKGDYDFKKFKKELDKQL